MSFLVRPARHEDVGQLVDLAKQFGLLNLPGEKKAIAQKIERSANSFSDELEHTQSEYLFVLEDVENMAMKKRHIRILSY
jgi:arginine N-succinyltransferase